LSLTEILFYPTNIP